MFIVFEGGEGVGKTTQIELVHKALKNKNLPSVKTREPGGTPLAEKIRNLFKEKNSDDPTPLAELYLVCAARAQHVEKVIRPNLQENKIILCDRFLDSTYVYQHILGNISKEIIDSATHSILQGLIPHITLVFHCDKKIASNRVHKEETRQLDRLDSYNENIQNIILNGYKKIIENQFSYPCANIPKRIAIDASGSIENVFAQIKNALKQHLSISL